MTHTLDASDGVTFEYAKDRDGDWEPCGYFATPEEFTSMFDLVSEPVATMENMDYVETMTYKGVLVPVFYDDYGQCFYCIYKGNELSFGTFNGDYENELKDIIDHDMDKKEAEEEDNIGTMTWQ